MTDKKNIVFVTQDSPSKNLTPAREFGELYVMLMLTDYRLDPNVIREKLKRSFEEQDVKPSDHLLLIGDPIVIGLAIHMALVLLPSINILRWDRKTYKYDSITLEADDDRGNQ